MQNILKQFPSEAEPISEKKPEKIVKDYLQQKYVTSNPVKQDKISTAASKPKKRFQTASSEVQKKSFLTLLTSPHFSARNYLLQLPTLFIGLIFYYACFLIFKNVQPAAIQNILIPGSYLPLILTVGFGTFFLFLYLSQNMRRSVLLSILFSLLLFLRIYHFWNFLILLVVILPAFVLELLLTYRSFRR